MVPLLQIRRRIDRKLPRPGKACDDGIGTDMIARDRSNLNVIDIERNFSWRIRRDRIHSPTSNKLPINSVSTPLEPFEGVTFPLKSGCDGYMRDFDWNALRAHKKYL